MQPIIVRTLFSEIRVWPGDEAAAKSFAFVRAAPVGGGRVGEPMDIAIEPLGAFYRMVLPDRPDTEGSLEYLVSVFQRFLGARLEREVGRYPVLHAASVVCESIRGLIIGSKGSGKTTLVLTLMMEGFSVEGDEHVMIREQTVLARPRTLRVKQTSLPLLLPLSLPLLRPLADTVAASPSSESWYGRVIYSVEPCGAPWRIEEGPAKLLIFIEPNHDGTSILTPMRREEAFERLLEMSYFPDGAPGAAVAALRMAAIGAKCLKLKLGNLERAVWHLRRAFSDARINVTSAGSLGDVRGEVDV